ncbi:hypothetical protein SLEP1_g45295 [Rubroshorea leprosula]|uniref:Uncharacterized protein n=1 Tax=Rubroshorea leprosula TaxID=152421 RepID=A0AAV5LKB5_9ROSI|nr:hypothetical protein SLEP1_g45295 [Rubroshorea leprosula]
MGQQNLDPTAKFPAFHGTPSLKANPTQRSKNAPLFFLSPSSTSESPTYRTASSLIISISLGASRFLFTL